MTSSPSILPVPLLVAIRVQYRLEWNGIHGVPHWARVLRTGLALAEETKARADVVTLFSVFHDACRHNDNHDPEHGTRGAALARSLHGHQFHLDNPGLALLLVACETHITGTYHPDVTVCTCWDADRLDLWRVGIRPLPSRLATEAGRHPQLVRQAIERSERDEFPWREISV